MTRSKMSVGFAGPFGRFRFSHLLVSSIVALVISLWLFLNCLEATSEFRNALRSSYPAAAYSIPLVYSVDAEYELPSHQEMNDILRGRGKYASLFTPDFGNVYGVNAKHYGGIKCVITPEPSAIAILLRQCWTYRVVIMIEEYDAIIYGGIQTRNALLGDPPDRVLTRSDIEQTDDLRTRVDLWIEQYFSKEKGHLQMSAGPLMRDELLQVGEVKFHVSHHCSWMIYLAIVLSAISIGVVALILAKAVRMGIRQKVWRSHGCCANCGYPLATINAGAVCPECGLAIRQAKNIGSRNSGQATP